jgi:hypothetical protein
LSSVSQRDREAEVRLHSGKNRGLEGLQGPWTGDPRAYPLHRWELCPPMGFESSFPQGFRLNPEVCREQLGQNLSQCLLGPWSPTGAPGVWLGQARRAVEAGWEAVITLLPFVLQKRKWRPGEWSVPVPCSPGEHRACPSSCPVHPRPASRSFQSLGDSVPQSLSTEATVGSQGQRPTRTLANWGLGIRFYVSRLESLQKLGVNMAAPGHSHSGQERESNSDDGCPGKGPTEHTQ